MKNRESPDGVAAAAVSGTIFGRELKAVGIDMDLAPVVDVNTNPQNRVIGDRSYGATPADVSAMGAAFIAAIQRERVAACAKHWPGHGDTVEDSHEELPTLKHDMERLRNVEMRPFEAAVAADVASVLVAHLLVPAMEEENSNKRKEGEGEGEQGAAATAPTNISPASCSEAVVGYLRRELNYDGLVMTDDMEMGALKAYSVSKVAVRGCAAGVDMFLMCHTRELQMEVVDAIAGAMMSGELSRERVLEAARRLDQCCAKYCAPPLPGFAPPPDPTGLVGTAEHKARMRDALKARL